ncbi:MAG: hypothetical protein JO170_05230 [Verrucomicrobia bacterium]|nr:hypothetical protein [Verrucomicrobiota bacterium]
MSADSTQKGYETKDVPFWPWVWFTAGFIVSLIVIYLLCLIFAKFLIGPGTIIGRTAHGRDATLDRFPHPQLQTNPPKDLHDYLQAKNQQLTTYGWVDRKNGVVHIPIEQAMDLFLSRRAPVRPSDSSLTEIDMQIQKAGGAKILPPAASQKPSP